jgi:hypothetical protein
VPSWQESDWELAGYLSAEDFQLAQVQWERVAEELVTLRDRMREIGPVAEAASISLNAFREAQDMALGIRHSEYPMRDGYGTYWYDPSGFHGDHEENCFICGEFTNRVDIDYHGYFCNSDECNEVIRKDLERLNGGPEETNENRD